MTPQAYLEYLNAESARRRQEQAARMLGDRATSTTSQAVTGEVVTDGAGSATTVPSMPQARHGIESPAATTPTLNPTTTEGEPTQTVAERLASPGHWFWGLAWAALAGTASWFVPGLGQLLTGRWLTAFVLFFSYDELLNLVGSWPWLADATGQTPDTLTGWFPWVVVAHAALAALRSTFAPKNPSDPSEETADDGAPDAKGDAATQQ
ncbi:hypothetical protein HMPREF3099_09795 [Kytococcus sp. HMSC28H12]|nr:hypothetical protein HMPREF3099_09795 [Kytococcus sp. HMSC28H12]